MGVYIKGMEMPKNCESCQFRRCISDLFMFGWVGCQLDAGMAKKESFNGRHPDCPLVEIEVPHGRLIDADAVTREMIADIGKRSIRIDTAITVLEAEGKDDG